MSVSVHIASETTKAARPTAFREESPSARASVLVATACIPSGKTKLQRDPV
jgi:hypothetical protein